MADCPVCGRTYGITHSCPDVQEPLSAASQKWVAPQRFAAGHYLSQGIAIARLDYSAVRAASIDKAALKYGILIWALGQVLIFAGSSWARFGALVRRNPVGLAIGLLFLISLDAVSLLIQYGLCHLLARWWFGARGSFICVLRPLLLGCIVTWLGGIPALGLIVAGLWSIAVMMIAFEEVDRITRLQAFALSAVIGLFVQGFVLSLLRPH